MSDHADTLREAIRFGEGWEKSEGVALAALDALVAENQRLRDALEQIAEGQPSLHGQNIAMRALMDLDGTP